MQAVVGQPFQATLPAPPGVVGLGARIEQPVTRAVVAAWRAATLDAGTGVWTVSMDAPVAAGDYELVWRTGDPEPPDYETFIPLTAAAAATSAGGAATTAQITPTVAEVGALLRARTYSGGDEVGTFNTTTRPTAEQVTELIQMAVGDVTTRVGTGIPVAYAEDAKRLAALQTASLVEASFFPGELDTDRSAYRQYQAMYLNGIESLTASARRPSAGHLV